MSVTIMSLPILATNEPENTAALAKYLLQSGAIPSIPIGRKGLQPNLITVHGQPVSETIVQERGYSLATLFFDSGALVNQQIMNCSMRLFV